MYQDPSVTSLWGVPQNLEVQIRLSFDTAEVKEDSGLFQVEVGRSFLDSWTGLPGKKHERHLVPSNACALLVASYYYRSNALVASQDALVTSGACGSSRSQAHGAPEPAGRPPAARPRSRRPAPRTRSELRGWAGSQRLTRVGRKQPLFVDV